MPDAPLFADATILDFGEDPGKEALLRTILVWLSDRGHISRAQIRSYGDAVRKREMLGSSGIGMGLAVPFFRLPPPPVTPPIESRAFLVLVRPCASFDSLDKEPVDVVTPLLQDCVPSRERMRLMERLSRSLKNESFLRLVRECRDEARLRELVDEVNATTP